MYPEFRLDFPLPLHLHMLIPNLYLLVQNKSVSNVVLTFQFPILVVCFVFTIEAVSF